MVEAEDVRTIASARHNVVLDDHGHSRGTATDIQLPSSTQLAIDYYGDVDYFRIEVQELGTLSVRAEHGDYRGEYWSATLVGRIERHDGTALPEDGEGLQYAYHNWPIERAVEPGEHYVAVRHYHPRMRRGTGNYILHVSFTPGAASAPAPAAGPEDLDNPVPASLIVQGGADWRTGEAQSIEAFPSVARGAAFGAESGYEVAIHDRSGRLLAVVPAFRPRSWHIEPSQGPWSAALPWRPEHDGLEGLRVSLRPVPGDASDGRAAKLHAVPVGELKTWPKGLRAYGKTAPEALRAWREAERTRHIKVLQRTGKAARPQLGPGR